MEPFSEAGVVYYNKEVKGTVPFRYRQIHLPSGKRFDGCFWVTHRNDGYKLLDCWNYDPNYKYRSIME